MNFTIKRGASDNKLVIEKDGKTHTYDLAVMKECSGMHKNVPVGKSGKPVLPQAVRQMVVDAWAKAHGYPPVYS